jgi:hypothetical protein
MAFQTIPVNIAGPSYQDRSRPLSSQETRNFYHEVVPSGKSQFVIKSFPGQTVFGSATAGADRNGTNMAEVEFRVVGETLYEVSSTGAHTAKGTVPGSARCIFANDGVNLFIVTGTRVFWYDGSTVVQVTDPDIDGSKAVTIINNQFVYTKDTLYIVSDVGDGSTASGLNAAGAEVSPDNLVRAYAFDQVVLLFGERTVQTIYNSGVGSPPFDNVEGQLISVGCAAIHSVANTKDAVYWLGSDRSVYRQRAGAEQKISSHAIANAIENYDKVDDAFAYTFVFQGQEFYALRFPTEGVTWCVNEELGTDGWFQLSAGTDGGDYNISSLVNAYGKNLIGDDSTGDLYELDIDSFDNNGAVYQRRRVLASINGQSIGNPGKRVQMSRFEFIMETGVGLITGQGEDPKIMLEYSTDGGKSWREGTWMRIGRLGETNIRAEWWSMISFYDLMIRITTSDPVDYSLYSGAIDVRLAGR